MYVDMRAIYDCTRDIIERLLTKIKSIIKYNEGNKEEFSINVVLNEGNRKCCSDNCEKCLH